MNISPRLLFLLAQTLQLALCSRAGNVLLASAKRKFILRTARWWSVIHHSRERISTVPESNGGKLYTTPAEAWHCDLRLVCGCSAMETHFIKVSTNSYCADGASRVRLELCSECCNWGQTVFMRYVLQHSAVPFCELVWPTIRSWAVVAPRRFHFTITALTVDCKTVVKRARQSLFALRKLKRFGMGPEILKRFYGCNIESILIGCITAWYGNCSPSTSLGLSCLPPGTSTPGGVRGRP
jgi:hypothetical protein